MYIHIHIYTHTYIYIEDLILRLRLGPKNLGPALMATLKFSKKPSSYLKFLPFFLEFKKKTL